MWEYTDKVQQHFLQPQNVGEIKNPSGTGDVGSLSCGDALKLTLKIENNVITDAKFKTFGCASAIASSSILTEMVRGLRVDEAAKITNEDIAAALGGLPKEKMHCSVMGREALEAAIADYRGVPLPAVEGEVVCECFGVTDVEIKRAVTESHLRSVEDITNFTKAGGGCEKCLGRLQEILNETLNEVEPIPVVPMPKKRMTALQKIKKIEEVLESEVRPGLKKDGGDIELVDVDGDTVIVSLSGTSDSSGATIRELVELKLREKVLNTLFVEEEK
ncbi:Fe-S cluster assembly protein NifU [Desulforhopalus vacuolatus]|uniref:Fe-S cluster assembly protein NifU n=1 Tax=Desulforhopalus vacuolatus TaxID=40414 RepID=UPI001966926E|nr:Fe-S cluster assembly protein NifU [Desulforhopalus vacuolatus]MBM9519065.1 Fe-S cluster assembly protein NifU [Desulforhopalus vacuolatus]